MPTPIGPLGNTPVSHLQDTTAPPPKKSEEHTVDANNVARPRVRSPAARAMAKTLKPGEFWKEESRAADVRLRAARGTSTEHSAVREAAAAYLERSKVNAPPAEQLAYVLKALQLFKGSQGSENFDYAVPQEIVQRYLEITFLQATGTKWTPHWDKTKFNCKVKDFDPEAFLKYTDMMKRPSASILDGTFYSDELMSVDNRLRRLYGSDVVKAREELAAHVCRKSEAADEAFRRTSGQPQETRQVAAQAAIAAYVHLASRADSIDEELKVHLRCIEIHEEVHGVSAAPSKQLSDIAFKAAEILFFKATGAKWGLRWGYEATGRSGDFKPDVFLKHREMIHKTASLSGESVSAYSSLESSLGVAYPPAELEKVLETLRQVILPRAIPSTKNDVGLNFDALTEALIAGFASEVPPEPTLGQG